MLGGVGSVVCVVFGIFWTVIATVITRGIPLIGMIFPLFGVIFILLGIVLAVYHFKNATSENRFSVFDITDGNEEPDPLNVRFGQPGAPSGTSRPTAESFCPYCGAPADSDFAYCRKCGKALPKE